MTRPRRAPGGRPGRRSTSPRVEAMEPRHLLATLTVSSLADAGPGTLREAIERANTAEDPDVIDFAAGLTGTIPLASALPSLSSPISVSGPGASALTVAGPGGETPEFRLLDVTDRGVITITGLTLTGGRETAGGAVRNSGSLTLEAVNVEGNRAVSADAPAPAEVPVQGGAIANFGTMILARSTVEGNAAGAADAIVPRAAGGAIENAGTLTIEDSILTGNRAVARASVSLFGGSADASGGAIRNSGTLIISRSTFRDNRAEGVSGLTVVAQGGAIENTGALLISDSTFEGNRTAASATRLASARAGAISNLGRLDVQRSTFAGNQAGTGLGSFVGSFGGAIENSAEGSALIVNSTLTDNLAGDGSAVSNDGVLTVAASTVVGAAGPALTNNNLVPDEPPPTRSRLILQDSIVATASGESVANRRGRVESLGNNLFSDVPAIDLRPTDLRGVDPRLGPLADNGGPTPTRALLPGSPAIDAAVLLADAATDQRGVTRPQGEAPDIGAFELEQDAIVFSLEVVSGNAQQAAVGTAFPQPLIVRAVGPTGLPVPGAVVVFDAFPFGPSAQIASNRVLTGPDGLASTTVVANAQAGMYTVVVSSPGGVPAQFSLENRPTPLGVAAVARLGFHARPTAIALTFDRPLDPGQAGTVANYRLFGPGLDRAPGIRPDRPLRLRSARYEAATNTVVLVPAEPLRLLGGRSYLVTVAGAVVPGGSGGLAATAIVDAEDFVPTPRLTEQLRRVQRLQRFRDGTGRLR